MMNNILEFIQMVIRDAVESLIVGTVVFLVLAAVYNVKKTLKKQLENVFAKFAKDETCVIEGITVHLCTANNARAKRMTRKAIAKIPAEIKELFRRNNNAVAVLEPVAFAEQQELSRKESEKVLGFIYCGSGNIFMKETSSQKSFNSTLAHEMGHFVDYFSADFLLSDTPLVQNLFKRARNQDYDKIGSYYLSNSKEFFAYCASEYMCNKAADPFYAKMFGKALERIQYKLKN